MNIEFFWNGGIAGTNHSMTIDGKEFFLGSCVSTEKEAKEDAVSFLKEAYDVDINPDDIVFKWGGRL